MKVYFNKRLIVVESNVALGIALLASPPCNKPHSHYLGDAMNWILIISMFLLFL
jgi:hypothetical protein